MHVTFYRCFDRLVCSWIINVLELHIHCDFRIKILLCEKPFWILLRPIREAKRVSHTWKNRFDQSQTMVYADCVFVGFFAVIAGSFVKIIFSVYTQVVRNSNLSRVRIYFWGWLKNQENLSLDKPIDKFVEDQKSKNTFKDTKNCKFADQKKKSLLTTEFLNSKNESRRIEEISVFIKNWIIG